MDTWQHHSTDNLYNIVINGCRISSINFERSTDGSPLVDVSQTAYPTDARERRKKKEQAARERGEKLEVKHKRKYIEPHFDDCGEDLKSLHMDLDAGPEQRAAHMVL